MTSRGISSLVSVRTRKSFVLFWAALFVLSLMLQYGSVVLASVSDSGTYSVVVPDNTQSATITTSGGASVAYIGDSASNQSSGTGVFQPFVRLQHSPTEAGYNTNGTPDLDTKVGSWTHAIKLSDIPVVTISGVNYWELFNDINETNSTPYVSLNKVEAYVTSDPNLTGYPFGSSATLAYAFSGAILINDVNSGSGRADLRYRIPLSGITIPSDCGYLNAACSTYFVLYSEWGTTGVSGGHNYNSDGGFEEWKVKQYPTLQIVKNTVGGDGTFNFTITGNPAPPVANPSITTSGGTGSTQNWIIDPGTYAITEGALPSVDWHFTRAACSINGGAPTTYTQGGPLVLGASDHVVCTITNTFVPPPAHLTLVKVVNNQAGGSATTGDWTLSAIGPDTLSGAGGASGNVAAGTYALSESAGPANYSASAWVCTGVTNDGSSVTLAAGATATCSITNTYSPPPPTTGTLIVKKIVDNTGGGTLGPSDFSFSANGGETVAFTATSATTGEIDLTVDAGSFTVTETPASNYSTSYDNCTEVQVAAGQSATCTITNTFVPLPAHLTLVKNVNNQAGGSATTGDWTLSAIGPETLSGAGGASGDVPAGTYDLSESAGPTGYTASAWVCEGGSLDGSSLVLVADETASCSITNTFVPGPSVTTQASANIQLGGSIWDTATVSNNPDPGSNWIEFQLFGPGAGCTGDAIRTLEQSTDSDTVTFQSPSFTPTEAGTYHWIANLWGLNSDERPTQLTKNGCDESNETVNVGFTPPPPPPPPPSNPPSMSIVKSNDTTGPVAPGTAVHYTLTLGVFNTTSFGGMTIVDALPPQITNATGISPSGTYDGGTNRITWSNLTITNGMKLTYTATVSAAAPAGTYMNNATIANCPAGSTCSASSTVTVAVPQTPTPTGAVKAVTATPRVTLPPTDSTDGQNGSGPGVNLGLILLVLAGISGMLGLMVPVPARIRRRDRRG